MALTRRAAVRVTRVLLCGPQDRAGRGWQTPSLPRQPYLSIGGLFASSSDIGKVLDDLLRVLSLAGTRFSTVGGKQEQIRQVQRGDWPQKSRAINSAG